MSYALKTKLRRLTAALTAFVLAFSLAPATAFASWGNFTDSSGENALTGSLTVNNVSADYHDIYVYQVAKTEVNSETNATQWVAVNDDNSGSLASAVSAWIDADGSTTTAEDLKSLIQEDSLGSLVASYVNETQGTSTIIDFSTVDQTTTASVSNLDPGIYVVLVENNSRVTDSSNEYYNYTYQTMVLSINVEADGTNGWKIKDDGNNASVLKGGSTLITKQILTDTTDGYYKEGDTLTFLVTFEVPSGTSDYFYVEDLMTGLTYVSGTLQMYTGSGVTITGAGTSSGSISGGTTISTDDYTVYTYSEQSTHSSAHTDHTFANTSINTDEQDLFHVDFDVTSSELSYTAGQTIYMVYQARITEYGVTNGASNTVTSSALTREDGYNPGEDPTTEVVAYALEIYKYYYASDEDREAETTTALQGATFAIYTAEDYEDSLYSSSTGWDTSDALVIAAVTQESDGKTIETNENGTATTTYALKAGVEYYVVETVVPSGYVMPTAGESFTIEPDSSTATFKEGTTDVWTISIENTPTDGNDPTEGGEGSGINLPVTGGLGTILLTAVGVLIIAAGACYTLRARKQQRRQQG